MFNLSGSEIIVILLLALVVLGPEKLPDAIRRAGRTYAELKRMGNSFQDEVRSVLDEPAKEMRETADLLRTTVNDTASTVKPERRPSRRPPGGPATRPVTPPPPAAEPATETRSRPRRGADQSDAERGLGPEARRAPGAMSPSIRGRQERPDMKTPDDVMTLTEHLGELRVRIIRAALAVTIGAIIIIAFYDQVLDFLTQPYLDLCTRKGDDFCGFDASAGEAPLNFFDPVEGLATRLRIGTYGGLILAMPVVLWQVWRFIVPALHKKEKRTRSRSSSRRWRCSCSAACSPT